MQTLSRKDKDKRRMSSLLSGRRATLKLMQWPKRSAWPGKSNSVCDCGDAASPADFFNRWPSRDGWSNSLILFVSRFRSGTLSAELLKWKTGDTELT